MKRIENPLSETYHEFVNEEGQCAIEAIAYLFKLDYRGVRTVFDQIGIDPKHAPSFHDCNKAIKILSSLFKKHVVYHTAQKQSFRGFINKTRKGKFIMNMDGHVSCYINGTVVDGWSPDSFKLFGWWEITEKYPRPKPESFRWQDKIVELHQR